MFKVVFKAVVLFWPFLKNLIFNDRTVREVLADNRQFTWLFGLLVVTLVFFYVTVSALADTKAALQQAQTELEKHRQQAITQVVVAGPDITCPTEPVNPTELFRLLTPTAALEDTP